MGLLWWLASTFGSHGIAFALGILAIPGAIVFLCPEIVTIIYRELVVKGLLFEGPKYKTASEIPVPVLDGEQTDSDENSEEKEEKSQPTTGRVSGWLIVRRQYKPSKEGILFTNNITDLTGAQKRRETTDSGSTGGGSSIKDKDAASIRSGQVRDGDDDDPRLDADAASTFTTDSNTSNSNKVGAAPSTTSSSNTTTTAAQRSWVQAARQTLALPKREAPARERFYCVLKGSVLYLYEDERQSDALAVLAVDRFKVGVETSAGPFDGKDGEMFAKKNAIVMRLWDSEKDKVDKGTSMPVLAKGMTGDVGENDMERAPWYLLSKNNSQLEDWYLALVQASISRPTMDDVFSFDDMQDLVKTIDAEQDPIPTRWLNAILGRVFFGLYRTAFVEEFIIGRIMKKLNKVVKPNWLSDISVQEINIGTFPPFFSKPMLKDLRSDGSITFEAYLRYVARENQPNSKIRITMAFLATIPVGFKSIQVPVVAAVMVKAMEGNMIFSIKPAPSNRIWYGFTTEPVMDIEISLMGAEWKVESSFILNQLKKFLKQAIAEVLVAPNFDDLAFFDTSKLDVRGGIFSEASKIKTKTERDEVSLKESSSQPGVVAKDGSAGAHPAASVVGLGNKMAKKRTSVLSETGSIEDKGKLGLGSKVQTESILSGPKGKNGAIGDAASTLGLGRATSISGSKTADVSTARPKGPTTQRPNTIHNDHHVGPGITEPSASAPNLISLDEGNTVTSSPASDRPPTVTSGFHPFPFPRPASIKSNETQSTTTTTTTTSSTSTATAGGVAGTEGLGGEGGMDRSTSPSNAGVGGSGSLLNSFRARDKQAIAAQMNTAKSAVRKWGIDFAAKRRADFQQVQPESGAAGGSGGLKSQPDTIPRAENTAASTSGTGTSLGHSPGRSLQERLNDAARAAAAANLSAGSGVTGIGNRERSASNLSNTTTSSSASGRPTLLSSPSKSGVVEPSASVSEPNFTLATHRSNPNDQSSIRRDSATANTSVSTSPPVLMQPSAGRSMIVPRVPKRPGQVTGLGSSPGSGLTRKTSDSSEVALAPGISGESKDVTPLRKSTETESPRPASDEPKAQTSPPPPLPARTIEDIEGGAEMQRSDSAPATTTQVDETKDESPIISISHPDQESPVAADENNGTPKQDLTEDSGAQHALRRLAEKDGQSRNCQVANQDQPLSHSQDQ